MPRKPVQCIITPGGKYLLSELHVLVYILVTVQSCKILHLFPQWLMAAMLGWGGYLAAPQLSQDSFLQHRAPGQVFKLWCALELSSERLPHCQHPLHSLLMGLGTGSGFGLR